jgi:hypothetical protein
MAIATRKCCASCRIRFTAASAAYLSACPACGESLEPLAGLAGAMGYRLFTQEDTAGALPDAIEVSMPVPEAAVQHAGIELGMTQRRP